MYEEDIYVQVGIGKDGFTTNEMNTKKMPNASAIVITQVL